MEDKVRCFICDVLVSPTVALALDNRYLCDDACVDKYVESMVEASTHPVYCGCQECPTRLGIPDLYV
jgi:hypothetical protein